MTDLLCADARAARLRVSVSVSRRRRTAASARRSCRVRTAASRSRSVRPAIRRDAGRSAGRGRCPLRRGSTDSRPGMRKNFSNTCSRSSGGMPGPSSVDRRPRRDARRPRDAATRMRRARRRVLAGVVEQDVEHLGDRRRDRPTAAADPSSSSDLHAMIARHRLGARERRAHDPSSGTARSCRRLRRDPAGPPPTALR